MLYEIIPLTIASFPPIFAIKFLYYLGKKLFFCLAAFVIFVILISLIHFVDDFLQFGRLNVLVPST